MKKYLLLLHVYFIYLQRFLGRADVELEGIPATDLPSSTINSVTVYGQQKHLVLIDTGRKQVTLAYTISMHCTWKRDHFKNRIDKNGVYPASSHKINLSYMLNFNNKYSPFKKVAVNSIT